MQVEKLVIIQTPVQRVVKGSCICHLTMQSCSHKGQPFALRCKNGKFHNMKMKWVKSG